MKIIKKNDFWTDETILIDSTKDYLDQQSGCYNVRGVPLNSKLHIRTEKGYAKPFFSKRSGKDMLNKRRKYAVKKCK